MVKRPLYVLAITLIASFVTTQQSVAQVPCGPTINPKAALFVNWPHFRYDAAQTGCNPYESILSPSTVGNLTLNWTYGNGGFFSSPAVANGIVYVGEGTMDGDGYLAAVNANTGAQIWRWNAGAATRTPVVGNGTVYVASDAGVGACTHWTR